MKRAAPWIACLAGIGALFALLPAFDAAQPRGVSITRDQARQVSDRSAKAFGIPIEKAWSVTLYEQSNLLTDELTDPARRSAANRDPIVGPRISYFTTYYFRPALEKNPGFGTVAVSRDGKVLGTRRLARNEEVGAKPSQEELRPKADNFARALKAPGHADPVFVDARPTTRNNRIDHAFRYRVPSKFDTGRVGLYTYIYFVGDQLAGFELVEEYVDGSAFRGEFGAGLAQALLQYGVLFALLLVLLIIFLKKYHAGEVGIGISAFLFAVTLVLHLLIISMETSETSVFTQFGGVDARNTAIALAAFTFLFYAIPVSVLVFLSWAVGESYARERWGERLASFDAIFHHADRYSATVGRALLRGLLYAPALAAAALLPAWIGIQLGWVHPTFGGYSRAILSTSGGPMTMLMYAAIDAVKVPVVAVLFILAFGQRKRAFWPAVVVALIAGIALSAAEAPVEPQIWRSVLGFGGIAACVAIFLSADLLAASTALFAGTLLLGFLPYLRAAEGAAQTTALATMVVPPALLLGWSIIGLLSRREISYEYDDLAPHVKRIVERERIRAEIDAANRIQAALLPSGSPELAGASVASHYRSATEIGGDYFDFLPLPNGEIGLAFGDVAGHGLTSGIVMAMAKSALLVQVGYDASPKRVLEVLNDTVMKTAPRRMMMTFFFGLLDPLAQQLRFSSAGHLDPYVFKAATGKVEPLSAWGFPLGIRRRDPFREMVVQFEPGDRLILYSDGLIEAVDDDGEPFGFHRFETVLQGVGEGSADEIKRAILDSVKRFTRNRPPEDDQTLVVVSFEEIEAARFFREERMAQAAGSALPN